MFYDTASSSLFLVDMALETQSTFVLCVFDEVSRMSRFFEW